MILSRFGSMSGVVILFGLGTAVSQTGQFDRPGVSAGGIPVRGATPKSVAGRPVTQILRDASNAITAREDDVSIVRALIEIAMVQARVGDKEGAVATARRASHAAAALQRMADRFYTLIAIGQVRAEAGDRAGGQDDIKRARVAADEVVDARDPPGVWREVAVAQARSGDRQAADSTLREMTQAVLAIPAGEEVRFARLSELVAAQAEVGDFDGAFRTVEAAGKGDHLKGHCLGLIARNATILPAPQVGEAFDREELQARRRVLARVAKEAKSIEQVDDKPDVPLAIALAEVGDFDEALRIARQFFKGPPRSAVQFDPTPEPFVLSRIAAAQGKAGRLGDARETFREALEKGRALVASGPGHVLDPITHDQVAAGDFTGAFRTLDSGLVRNRPEVLIAIAQAQVRVGDADGARATYRRALQETYRGLLELSPPPTPPAGELAALENPLDRQGDDRLTRASAIEAMSGDLKAALRTLDAIDHDDARAVAVREIGQARASAGDVDGTLAWALTLNPLEVRLAALQGLATGVSARGIAPRRDGSRE